jgi:hypothetical protein
MACRGIALATVLFAFAASPAGAQSGTGGTAPAYPGNTLALAQIAPIVAGTTTKVRLSGHAQWNEPTDDLTIPYTLSIYVQNADVDPRAEPSKGAQLQKAINVATLGASETITVRLSALHHRRRGVVPAPGQRGAAHMLVRAGRRSTRPGPLDLVQLHGLPEGELPSRVARSRQGREARRHGQGARVDGEPVGRALQRVDDEREAGGAGRQAQDRARALTLSCPAADRA